MEDALVDRLFISILNLEILERSLSFENQLRAEAQELEQGWQDELKRLAYHADLMERRSKHVDPANRLVTQTLETEWSQALEALDAADPCTAPAPSVA